MEIASDTPTADGALSDDATRDRIAAVFADLCVEAGAAIMAVYGAAPKARLKADASPVTEADERAEALILAGLAKHLRGWPVVAEEACARAGTPRGAPGQIFVDPLDGTREFLSRNGEFTVNIGLVERGVPRVGAIYAPALGRLWVGGASAFVCDVAPGAPMATAVGRRPLAVRRAQPGHWAALASRSHGDEATEAFLARFPVVERRAAGSSLKFCLLAEGQADVYPRFGPTMEWDTAAGDAILRAAGGIVVAPNGTPLTYGKAELGYRNGPFVAWGDPEAARASRAAGEDHA